MDETTKILIGTLSGFVIAFFAEPVKIYFQNSAKLKYLMLGLYKEMWSNFTVLNAIANAETTQTTPKRTASVQYRARVALIKTMIRTEFYQQTLKENLHSFYRMKEALCIHQLYAIIPMLLEYMDDDTLDEKGRLNMMSTASNTYVTRFLKSIADKSLNKALLQRIMSKKEFKEVIIKAENCEDTQK